MAKILKKSSFGLIRTNPKLTTNVKIIADSKNQVYLESFDADPLLSKSIYKGYNVTGGSFARDINEFYSQGSTILPKSIAYKVYERDSSIQIKDRYKLQYDFTYCMGMEPKNSRIYDEEFSLFFPLWIERNSIPDYFLIFKLDGPVSIDYSNYDENLDNSPILENLVSGPTAFFDNYIKNSKIIKTFDLTERSAIGKYIRDHVNNSLFPEASAYISFNNNEASFWNGISYDDGGFASKAQDIYRDYVLIDKTVTENDDFITLGFQNNGIVHPNILNLEFLFDDFEQEKYKFSRYFGLYVSEAELGKFEIDGSRLFKDKDAEISQIPTPNKDIFGYSNNLKDQVQTNVEGIKIYPKIGASGGTSIFQGRLITVEETQKTRIPYVKDAENNFYSISATKDWKSEYIGTGSTSIIETSFLRLKNQKINWKTFSGFFDPIKYINVLKTEKRGRPHFSFRVINKPENGDQIRIFYTDWNDPEQRKVMDYYTIIATDDITIRPGNNRGLLFSTEGTDAQVANAISKAINYIDVSSGEQQIFSSISLRDTVLVFCKVDSENWNKIKYSMFSKRAEFPWSKPNEYVEIDPDKNYVITPVSLNNMVNGNYLEYNFNGGCDNPKSRFVINKEDYDDFVDSTDPIYLKTETGFDLIGDYSFYLDEPIQDNLGNFTEFKNIDKYYVYQLKSTKNNLNLTSSKSVALYKTRKNSNGYLSIFPIREFDFDFLDTSYSKNADANVNKIYEFYKGATSTGSTATFTYSSLGSTSQGFIDSILGPTSLFSEIGFQKLNGQIEDILDENISVVNEYDRLKENELSELALSSRVVPFINKWVYDDDSLDVRENSYRLNTDQSFGYSNFSPSFDEISSNSKFFTHEWYYLQKYPPYMTYEEKKSSFSYFDYNLNFPTVLSTNIEGSTAQHLSLIGSTGNLLSSKEDYFLSYFTRETVGGSAIPRDFKYSQFVEGTDIKFPETFFRGIKLTIKDRTEFSEINYNIQSLRLSSNVKYNDYKFSAVLTYLPSGSAGNQITFVKNDIWKTVTMVIQSDLNDDVLLGYRQGPTSEKFIDRCHFYTLKDRYNIEGGTSLVFSNKALSGEIFKWRWDNAKQGFRVSLRKKRNGSSPNLLGELSKNENGGYNNIVLPEPVNSPTPRKITFKDVTEITSESFFCSGIDSDGIYSVESSPEGDIELRSNGTFLSRKGLWALNTSQTDDYAPLILSTPIYIKGGFEFYSRLFEEISFASIANSVNSGAPEIRYINVNENQQLQFNTFLVELIKPDYPVKSTYIKYIPTKNKPSVLQNLKGVIGFELTSQERAIINQISRYRGNYNPKTRDLLKFIDTDEILNYNLEYNNVQIFDSIDYDRDENLLKLKNIYYNKVNVENSNVILKSSTEKIETVYPLIGEIAIANKDFFTFKSNWDTAYYSKSVKSDLVDSIAGTREPKENKSYFGSKIVAIPSSIRLETFPQGIISRNELGSETRIKSVPQNIITEEAKSGSNNLLKIKIFTALALEDYLIADGFDSQFIRWINPNYSFGSIDLEDDIKLYIQENIVDRYSINEIVLWEKFWPSSNPAPPIVSNLTDQQKISNGYSRSRNFTTRFDDTSSLDFELIYNIPKDRNYSIAFSVILEKK